MGVLLNRVSDLGTRLGLHSAKLVAINLIVGYASVVAQVLKQKKCPRPDTPCLIKRGVNDSNLIHFFVHFSEYLYTVC